jgi:hypothetical protein
MQWLPGSSRNPARLNTGRDLRVGQARVRNAGPPARKAGQGEHQLILVHAPTQMIREDGRDLRRTHDSALHRLHVRRHYRCGALELIFDSRSMGQLPVERLAVPGAAAQELRPVRRPKVLGDGFGQKAPKLRVMPAQVMSAAVGRGH